MKIKSLKILVFCCFLIGPALVKADVIVVALMDESAVALIDAVTNSTLVKFATGRGPHEVRISPDKRYAYVAAGRHVTAVDLKERRVKRTYDLGQYSAHDIRISRDGKIFWAACAQAKSVVEVDVATGKILKTYDTGQEGSWFVEVSPDERKFFTPNLEGKSVSIIDRATGSVTVIPLEAAGYGIDVTPDGKHLWVSGGEITVIDTSTAKPVAKFAASEKETGRLRITEDGKRVVVAMSKSVAVYDTKTRRLLKEIPLEEEPKVMTLSRDGRFAYLSNPAHHSMAKVDLVDGRLISNIPIGRKPDGIGWAP